MIVIIEYGMGNNGSIKNMLKKIGYDALISSKASDISKATRLILPGIGSFDSGMKRLTELDLIPLLNKMVIGDKVPILGICLGMQLFAKRSEEGRLPGLGWIDADVIRFRQDDSATPLRIPHIQWNIVRPARENGLFGDARDPKRFYFVHTYHLARANKDEILSMTTYGYDFASSVKKDNIIGVQFHPEKSHRYGMDFFKNFLEAES